MKEATAAKDKLTYLLATLVILLASASALFGPILYLPLALFSALAFTVLFRFYHFGVAVVPSILAFLLMGGLLGFSFDVLLLALLPAAVGFTLATCIRRGEDRLSLSIAVTVISLLIFGLYALLALRDAALAAGTEDLFAFALSSLDAYKAEMVELQLQIHEEFAALFAAQGITYPMPTASALETALVRAISLAPAAVVVLFLTVAVALTYALSLLALLLGDKRLFDEKNAVYKLGAPSAAVYLLLTLITLFYTDFSSPFYLVCINTAEVLSPLFFFGAILQVPRLFAFIRHMSYSKFDFTIWVVLLVLCALSYFSTLFTLLAVWQALHILISALRARNKKGRA